MTDIHVPICNVICFLKKQATYMKYKLTQGDYLAKMGRMKTELGMRMIRVDDRDEDEKK